PVATQEQLDITIIYAADLAGVEGPTDERRSGDMRPLSGAMLKHGPRREDDADSTMQMQIITSDHNTNVRKSGIRRGERGKVRPGQDVLVQFGPEGERFKGRINQVQQFSGLDRKLVDEAEAGDIVLINGIEDIGIGCTVMDPDTPEPLPMLRIDEPTLSMNFMVNSSPLAGREGKYVTSRQLRDRLERELKSNVALRVNPTDDDMVFEVR